MSKTKTLLDESASNFLIQASLLYKDTCVHPVHQIILLLFSDSSKGCRVLPDTAVCSFCYQWLQPDNHTVRLRPKRRPSAQVQSALRREARGKPLSMVQKDLLQQFYKSSSVLMATCHTCNRTSRHKGMGREFITLSRSHSTPGSTGKHKAPSQVSISTNTPGSGSTSSKSPGAKGKNWVVQRLSKILMREDGQDKKKGG
uniref:Si:dkey-184p18.2 n=1 Tax=Neogobius melanostomus TaxID=47308 RepID=A0A8C6SUG5_9GOBI